MTYNPGSNKLILASGSPRRAWLLESIGLEFQVDPTHVSEDLVEVIPATEVPVALARRKAAAHHLSGKPGHVILAADTVVILGNQILNKPGSVSEARAMLHGLSGKTHRVITGVCLANQHGLHSFSEESQVTFRQPDPETIQRYIEKFQPFDKAGSYGIQECLPPSLDPLTSHEKSFLQYIGKPGLAEACRSIPEGKEPVVLIEQLEGSFFNVVGLPIATLWLHLNERQVGINQAR